MIHDNDIRISSALFPFLCWLVQHQARRSRIRIIKNRRKVRARAAKIRLVVTRNNGRNRIIAAPSGRECLAKAQQAVSNWSLEPRGN